MPVPSLRLLPLALTVIAACAQAADDDATAIGPDAGKADEGGTTTPADPNCNTELVDPAGVMRGHAGGTGGGKGPVLACDDVDNERIVGMAIRMSNQNTVLGGRSAQGISIACAHVAVAPDGTAQVGTPKVIEVNGTGANMWSPSTSGNLTSCQPGWVVSGFKIHTGTNNNQFIDATMYCRKIDSDGNITATGVTVKLDGSLTSTVNVKDIRCGTGEVVSQFGTWTGAGIDALDVLCSKPKCR